jgi:uncharacterized protein (DUF1501 family)
MAITRRVFVRNGAMALIATTAVPGFLVRAVAGSEKAAAGAKRLVIIFQRGAADGLNIVVPHGESAYYAMRPTIAIPRNQVVNLDGFFGLHPALRALKPLWDNRQLAIVHAAGSPDPTRSHFDAQDYMESGTPGVKTTADGWLNRALGVPDECRSCIRPGELQPNPVAGRQAPATPFSPQGAKMGRAGDPLRAVAIGPSLPRILAGRAPALAINNLADFGVGRQSAAVLEPPANSAVEFAGVKQPLTNAFEAIYDRSSDTLLQGTAQETFGAVKALRANLSAGYRPAPGANYPPGRFSDALRQTAQLIKAELGVRIAFADVGGWDHHVNEGAGEGQLSNLLRNFAESISAFWTDLGRLAGDTVLVTMSEFGRTARENGTRGTDHGHGNVMLVLGGPVRGGKIYGRWPGLDARDLYEGRDLALTTDFRTVLGEAVANHLGNRDLRSVFPGFDASEVGFLRWLG